ncbi:hypothetical protein AMS68_000501 [Peltaster fructicola]|uniref:Translation initiation factor 3 N-terminal domain-containing protein n=1 Tax=Peltaster fructicola TaxID=286661 RepID=A0A6H0XJT8_9PEZI|nr:hypothetical protein AMS68_000501 [Peltaster fructicola]
MAKHSPLGPAQALYRVFAAQLSLLRLPQLPRTRFLASTSPVYIVQQRRELTRRKTAKPEIRKEKWNEEIQGDRIILVDQETGKLQPPVDKRGVLMNLDLNTHRLVQVEAGNAKTPDRLAICKIIDKKAQINARRERKEANKDATKARAMAISLKTIELNWAIDPNDLGHRLDKFRSFLQEGRKVDVVLAPKKRGRLASPEECRNVISRIQDVVKDTKGATASKPMEGKIGGVAMFSYQGRAITPVTSKDEELPMHS